VAVAVEAFTRAATDRQWRVETVTESETFARLPVVGQDDLMVDIGLDSPPDLPPTMSILGPTFAPRELAARKLLALFDRAMPRDFVDVFRLVQLWDRDELMSLARAMIRVSTPRSLRSRCANSTVTAKTTSPSAAPSSRHCGLTSTGGCKS